MNIFNVFNILLQFRGNKLYDIPRIIFSVIDKGVYALIGSVYDLIIDLSYIRIFSDDVLAGFYSKVYGLLSIIMLFKITFSVVSYILDPSKMSDKQQGFGKIITNILVMFVMLISCPVVFELLYDAQSAILSDNIIPNFIFGSSEEGASASDGTDPIKVADAEICAKWSPYINNYEFTFNSDEVAYWTTKSKGDYIAMMVFRSFYRLGDPEETSKNLWKDETGYTVLNWCKARDKHGNDDPILNATVGKMLDYVNNEHEAEGTGGYYLIEYNFFVSTVFGVVVAFLFISIAFDIATRSIKLSFLQLIAPIPIISYIDPASGKNGTFSKWVKEVGTTWASLFIRLFSIFFAIFAIQQIDNNMIENSFEGTGREPRSFEFFIMLFIIIGALMFAKKLPQLIEELIPGLKMGKMQLNPLKKIEEDAIGGKQIAGAVRGVGGAARGLAGGMVAGAKAGAEAGNIGKGLLLGAGQGLAGGFKKPQGAFSNSMNQTYKNLTGNELARLSFGKMIAQAGSGKKMDEVNSALKNLNTKQRGLAQKLSVQEHTTAEAASNLQASGVDLNNLDEERKNLTSLRSNQIQNRSLKQYELDKESNNLAQLQAKKVSEQNAYSQAISERDRAIETMKNAKITMYDAYGDPMYGTDYYAAEKIVNDFSSKEAAFKANIAQYDADIATSQADISRRQAEINNIDKSILATDESIRNIDKYRSSYDEAIATRSEISKNEKDIAKLKDEKAQRAKFNQVESKSPRSEVKKIIKENKNS